MQPGGPVLQGGRLFVGSVGHGGEIVQHPLALTRLVLGSQGDGAHHRVQVVALARPVVVQQPAPLQVQDGLLRM